MKNTLEEIIRLGDREDWMSNPEERAVEVTQAEEKKRIFKNEDSLRDL